MEYSGARVRAQWLRASLALPEDPSLVSSSLGQLTTVRNSSLRKSDALFGLVHIFAHTCTQIQIQT